MQVNRIDYAAGAGPDETYSGGDTECAEQCDRECEGNGLLASLLAAAVSIPICGTLVRYARAWQ
eukprot:COSAG02_NODE_89_length_38500_cov_61.646910_22_plen_64_part_00